VLQKDWYYMDLNKFIVRINDDSRVHSHIFRQQLYFLIVSGLGLINVCISACYIK
jgi:hypothetical protein